jgi:copper transport protein
MRKRWRSALAAVVLAVLINMFGGTQTASAHASVLRTDPPDGAVLSAAPKQLHIWFSEAILLKLSHFELDDSHGRRIAISPAHAGPAVQASSRGLGGAADETAAVVIDVPPLAPGAYRLSWRVVSAVDLHSTTGDLAFGIQSAADIAKLPTAGATPSPTEVLLRWVNFGGIAGLIGAMGVALLVVPASLSGSGTSGGRAPAPADPTEASSQPELGAELRRRLLGLGTWSGVAALLGGLGLLAVQATAVGDRSTGIIADMWSVLTSTAFGVRWTLGSAVLTSLILIGHSLRKATATVAQPLERPMSAKAERHVATPGNQTPGLADSASVSTAARGQASRALLALLAVLALALLVLQALQSHAAAAIDSSPMDILAATAHLLGACVWTGGVVALAVGCASLLRRGPEAVALARATLRRFGLPALASVVVLAVTGLYAAGRLVATPDALLLSLYGQTLLLKVGLVLAVGFLGLFHTASLHPSVASALGRLLRRPEGWRPLSNGHVGRTIVLEAGGVAAIVLLAAALAGSQPARGPAFDPPAAGAVAASQNLAAPADDLYVIADAKPARVGQNFITLGIYNTRRPAPAPIDSVDVRLVAPAGEAGGELRATAIGSDQFQIPTQTIAASGQWHLIVVTHRAGMPDATVTMSWTVLPPLQPTTAHHPALISQQSLAPLVNIAAVLLSLLAIAAGAAWWLGRRVATLPQAAPAAESRAMSLVRKE